MDGALKAAARAVVARDSPYHALGRQRLVGGIDEVEHDEHRHGTDDEQYVQIFVHEPCKRKSGKNARKYKICGVLRRLSVNRFPDFKFKIRASRKNFRLSDGKNAEIRIFVHGS